MIFLLLSTQSSCFRIMHLIKSEQTATNSLKLYVLNVIPIFIKIGRQTKMTASLTAFYFVLT